MYTYLYKFIPIPFLTLILFLYIYYIYVNIYEYWYLFFSKIECQICDDQHNKELLAMTWQVRWEQRIPINDTIGKVRKKLN